MKIMNLLILSLVTVSALALTGCGRDKADATKDYPVKSLGAEHGLQSPDQHSRYLAYRITTLKSSEGNSVPRFYEGDPGTAKFQLEILDPQITAAELALSGTYPKSATLERSHNEKNVWILKWTPEQGTIDPKQGAQELEVQLMARTLSAKTEKAYGITKPFSQTIVVFRSKLEPKIVNETVPKTIEEGTNTSFTISFKDPAARGVAPALEVVKYTGTVNGENPKFDALPYISQSHVSGPNSEGVYVHTFAIDTSGKRWEEEMKNEMKKSSVDGVDLCFTVRVISRSTGNKSNDQSPCLRAMFSAQPPVPQWKNDPDRIKDLEEVTAGKAEAITFTAKTFNEKGNVLVLDTIKKFLASLPSEKDGAASMDCGDQTVAAPARTCTISWTPSCKAVGKSFDLNLAMKTVLGTTSKTRSEKRKITVTKKAESCDAKGSSI